MNFLYMHSGLLDKFIEKKKQKQKNISETEKRKISNRFSWPFAPSELGSESDYHTVVESPEPRSSSSPTSETVLSLEFRGIKPHYEVLINAESVHSNLSARIPRIVAPEETEETCVLKLSPDPHSTASSYSPSEVQMFADENVISPPTFKRIVDSYSLETSQKPPRLL